MDKYNLKYKTVLFFILAVVLFSLIARSAHLTRPLGIHGENASSHVLVTMLSYESNSIESHYFLPIYQLGNPTDKYINNMAPSSLMTDQGNHIYVSFPALGYVLPYAFLKITNIPIDEFGLRIFNLTLHLIFGCALLYLLTLVAPGLSAQYYAVATAVIFLAPEVMWSFSNAYWMHSPAQIFFTIGIIFWLIYKKNKKASSAFWLFSFLTLTSLTEWFGYIFALGVFLWEFIERRSLKPSPVSLLAALSVIISLGLTLWHFSFLLNLSDVIEILTNRASTRSKVDSNVIITVLANYALGFGALMLLPILTFKLIKRHHYGLIFITLFPIIENVLLSSHAKFYTYATLKLAIPLGILLLIFLTYPRKHKRAIISGVFVTNIVLFQYVNSPFWNPYFENIYRQPGQVVRSVLKDDQVGFTNKLLGHIVFYTKRHLQPCSNNSCIQDTLNRSNTNDGWYFVMKNKHYRDFNLIALPYFYGFHNGVIESYIKVSKINDHGAFRSAANINIMGSLNGFNSTKQHIILSKSIPLFDHIIQKAKQVTFEDNHLCMITDVADLDSYLIVTFSQKCGATKKQAAYPALLHFE